MIGGQKIHERKIRRAGFPAWAAAPDRRAGAAGGWAKVVRKSAYQTEDPPLGIPEQVPGNNRFHLFNGAAKKSPNIMHNFIMLYFIFCTKFPCIEKFVLPSGV